LFYFTLELSKSLSKSIYSLRKSHTSSSFFAFQLISFIFAPHFQKECLYNSKILFHEKGIDLIMFKIEINCTSWRCFCSTVVEHLAHYPKIKSLNPEASFLVVCDPSMNELWVTLKGLCIDLYGSKSLTVHLWKGCTQLKIRALLPKLREIKWVENFTTKLLPHRATL
jgi:hypothetical protein